MILHKSLFIYYYHHLGNIHFRSIPYHLIRMFMSKHFCGGGCCCYAGNLTMRLAVTLEWSHANSTFPIYYPLPLHTYTLDFSLNFYFVHKFSSEFPKISFSHALTLTVLLQNLPNGTNRQLCVESNDVLEKIKKEKKSFNEVTTVPFM